MRFIVALILALILNSIANLCMKIGMKGVHSSGGLMVDGAFQAFLKIAGNVTLIIGLICFALNAALYMYALQSPSLKISVAYPIMVGGGYALIAIVARLHPALAEVLNWRQVFGVVLVFAGILLITSTLASESPKL